MIIEILELVGLLLAVDGVVTEEYRLPDHPYVEYIPGNTNLVISVPHDGRVEPPGIPLRRPGCRDSEGGSQVVPADHCLARSLSLRQVGVWV